MLINSNDIKTTKKYIEVMQAFIDGKEIEYKKKFAYNMLYGQCTTPTWDFDNYAYRIKPSEPVYAYPIYKRLKETPETVVKFHSLDSGIYVSTHKNSIYIPGHAANNMAPHTDSAWEDCTVLIAAQSNTEELFEVMIWCDIAEEFKINGTLYLDEDLKQSKYYQKTGRSFIIDKDTKKIIKVINQ